MPHTHIFGTRRSATPSSRTNITSWATIGHDVRAWRTLFSLLLIVVVSLAAERAAAQVRTVAVTGDAFPDRNGTFDFFYRPVMNIYGEVAFGGGQYDENDTTGIWSSGYTGELRTAALTGDTDPETNVTFDDFFDPEKDLYLSDLGDVAFLAEGNDYTVEGIWTDRFRVVGVPSEDDLEPVVLMGDIANNTIDPTRTLHSFVLGGFDDEFDRVVLRASMTEGETDVYSSSGIFAEDTSLLGVNKIAEEDDVAPGTVDHFKAFRTPTINDSGMVAFVADLPSSVSREGVWTADSNGTVSLVALNGQTAPGTGGRTFSILFRDDAIINNNGDIAFTATLTGYITGNLREGIWVRRGGSIEKVMFESEPAPGTSTTFEEITSTPLLDEAGHVTFVAETNDTSPRDGLWSEGESGLELIALQGEPAPGTDLTFENILDFAVNDSGFVAFAAQLSDLSEAIFAQDPTGNLRRIVGDGDTIQIYVEDELIDVEIEFVEFLGLLGEFNQPGNGVTNGWNDAHQVAFKASFYSDANLSDHNFTDGGEGVFVSDLATVPLGDMNFDGNITEEDIPLFVQALVDRDAYDAHGFVSPVFYALPIPADVVGDVNQDGVFDFGDISAFSALFDEMATSNAVPEPSSGLLLILATACWANKKRSAQGDRRCAGAG